MTRKSSEAKKMHARTRNGRTTARERNAASTAAMLSLNDPDDATLGFGPRNLDLDGRIERLSYRDPGEISQGPLRLDEINYSVERLTLPEGGYNEYADEVLADHDEEGTPRMHYGPTTGDSWQNPQYRDAMQNDLSADLPPSDDDPANESDASSDLDFLLTAEDLETSSDYIDRNGEKTPGFGRHTARLGNRTDELIREEIYEVLDGCTDIDAPDISLHVKNGVITIEGEVTDAMLRHRIEECVDSVEGVKGIHNRLHLAASRSHTLWGDE